MLLYVMRHGPAEDAAPSGRDFDRGLTMPGRELVAQAAQRLSQARPAPLPRILSSPLVRARQTSEIVRRFVCPPDTPLELHDDLQPQDAPPLTLLHDIVATGIDTLLVGHQPSVEYLVRSLALQPRLSLPSGFRTAMIVGLALEGAPSGTWTPHLVLDPRESVAG